MTNAWVHKGDLDPLTGRVPRAQLPSHFDLLAERHRKLATFHAALGKVTTSPADIYCIGDSVTEGATLATRNGRWVDVLRDTMRAKYPSGATGGYGYVPSWYGSDAQTWTFTGTKTLASFYGPGRREARMQTGATATLSFTGTGVDIWYVENIVGAGLGQFTYTIDGGSATTVDAGVATGLHDGVIKQVRGLSAGTHTLVITASTGQTFLCGAMVYNGDEAKGVRVWDGGHYGFGTDDIVNSDTKTTTWLQYQWGPIQPDLVIIEFCLNDYKRSLNPAACMDRLATLIDAARANTTVAPSIMLWVPYKRGFSTPPAPYNPVLYGWDEYVSQLYNLAFQKDVLVWDAYARYGDFSAGVDPLGLMSSTDLVHPTTNGHAMMARHIAAAIDG